MNNVFSTLALATCLATSASAYTYNTPGVATGGALTGWDIQPTYSIDALYAIAAESADPDMFGFRLGFSLYNNGIEDIRHQFGIYFSPMWGSETYSNGVAEADVDVTLLPITFGYDVNFAMSDKALFSIGAKAGYVCGKMDSTVRELASGMQVSDSVSDGGFTFSVGAAIKVNVSDVIQLKAGYEYSRNYLDGNGIDAIYGAHIISVGVGCTF